MYSEILPNSEYDNVQKRPQMSENLGIDYVTNMIGPAIHQ